MSWLEHRIPPPLVGLLVGVAMWQLAKHSVQFGFPFSVRLGLGLAWAVFGVALAGLGVSAFRRAQTTVNPLNPDAASALVVLGVFRHTRNPMYVGMCLVLLGWAIYLAAPWTLLGPVLFAAYITRFQIIPEERAMADKFGKAYADYRAQVRRWL